MRNLDPPRNDPMAVYDAVIEHKEKPHEPRLKGLRGRIVCAYLRYYARTDRLERLPRLRRRITVDEAASLKSCYDSKTDAWKRIYSDIRKLSKKCSYCGVRDVVGLDHYLPRDGVRGYPEFNILPVNLVPACDRCNDNGDFTKRDGPTWTMACQKRARIARAQSGLSKAWSLLDDVHRGRHVKRLRRDVQRLVPPSAVLDRSFEEQRDRDLTLNDLTSLVSDFG